MVTGRIEPCISNRVVSALIYRGAWLEERKAMRKSIRKGKENKPKLGLVACVGRWKRKSKSC